MIASCSSRHLCRGSRGARPPTFTPPRSWVDITRVKRTRERALKLVEQGRAFWGKDVPVVAKAAPGRNDPCPCGSGRKYKKCCLVTA